VTGSRRAGLLQTGLKVISRALSFHPPTFFYVIPRLDRGIYDIYYDSQEKWCLFAARVAGLTLKDRYHL